MRKILSIALVALVLICSVSCVVVASENTREHEHGQDCGHEHYSYLGRIEPSALSVSLMSSETETPPPEATFAYGTADNRVSITWTATGCTATLNGKSYTKGTWITQEGSYEFIITDGEGQSTRYPFTIAHYYTTAIVPATCSERGYTRHTCKQCGHFYDTDSTPILGHKYIESTVYASCTTEGGIKHTCTVCDYSYLTDIVYASGHSHTSTVLKEATCTANGQRHEKCDFCNDEETVTIPALGHNYLIIEVTKVGKTTQRKLQCSNCGSTYTENLGNQYEKVGSYMELIFNTYRPYMVLVFVGTAGVWSIFIGISYIIAKKNEEKEKAKRMLVNYIVGLIAIFSILVACPYLIRGITALVT